MKGLAFRDVSSGYGSKEVVRGVSLELREGELCALIGLNGCGKSTLIKTLCALLPARQGECTLDGSPYWTLDEKQRARLVAYIPQRGSTISGRTCLDVVLMGFNARMGVFGHYLRKHIKAAEQAMMTLGLAGFEDRLYETLSEGQKQLVILARTLVQNTKVVLMDEPDSALDFSNRNQILATLEKLVHQEKKICLVTLHDPNAALDFCDRILLMKDGVIIHDLDRSSFSDYGLLQKALSDVYRGMRIIDNDGAPVMVRAREV